MVSRSEGRRWIAWIIIQNLGVGGENKYGRRENKKQFWDKGLAQQNKSGHETNRGLDI